MLNVPTDNETIDRVLQGEKQAYAILVKRYQNFVFTIALRYAHNRQDAEELAQDVFLKAYRCLADYRREAKFSTWLYTIVNSTCLTFLRKKKPEVHSLDNEKIAAITENKNSEYTANGTEQKSKAEMLHHAISLLNADDAKIITLFYKGEQTLEEIGIILGVDPNTAKVRLYRARQRLKEKMEKYFASEIKAMLND